MQMEHRIISRFAKFKIGYSRFYGKILKILRSPLENNSANPHVKLFCLRNFWFIQSVRAVSPLCATPICAHNCCSIDDDEVAVREGPEGVRRVLCRSAAKQTVGRGNRWTQQRFRPRCMYGTLPSTCLLLLHCPIGSYSGGMLHMLAQCDPRGGSGAVQRSRVNLHLTRFSITIFLALCVLDRGFPAKDLYVHKVRSLPLNRKKL